MRWLDDVSTDLRKVGISEWRDRARGREAWGRIVKEAKAHPGCSAIEEGEEDAQFVHQNSSDSLQSKLLTRIPKFRSKINPQKISNLEFQNTPWHGAA